MKKLKDKLLEIFGCIKLYKWPMFIIYEPEVYQIGGKSLRRILDVIRPGDIVCRGYRHYVDNFFIPGKYAHSGIYLGDNLVAHAVAEGVIIIDVLEFFQCDRAAILRVDADDWVISCAILKAKQLVGTEYDYDFTSGTDKLYCHELVASCYPDIGIEKKQAHLNGILSWVKKKEPVYLYDSFVDCPNIRTVIEIGQ